MPKINIYKEDLEDLVGIKFDNIEFLEEALSYVKCELEEIYTDEDGYEVLKIETKDSVRIDLWSVEGIARELKSILGLDTSYPKLILEKSENYKIFVDSSLKEIRPYIAGVIIKDVKLDKKGVKSLIEFQEKINFSFGRRRKKLAIGMYDLDKIKFPLYYKLVDPKEYRYKPLNYSEEMYLDEIIEKTDKGKEYGWILNGLEKYPVLVDSDNKVLALIPILSSEDLKITENTRNIFVDITGTDLNAIEQVATTIAFNLFERGSSVVEVITVYDELEEIYPKIRVREIEINKKEIEDMIGIELSENEIEFLLKKLRYNVNIEGNRIRVIPPPYRYDIFDVVDIVEDLAISYGYNNLPKKKIEMVTFGGKTKTTKFVEKLEEICIGLGLIQIHTPVLSSRDILLDKMDRQEDLIELENPVSSSYAYIRDWLIPKLLEFLSKNTKEPYPQNIFEIGKIAKLKEGKITEELHLGIALASKDSDYSRGKSISEKVFKSLGINTRKLIYEREDHPSFIPGRRAIVIYENEKIAEVGEIHPKILEKFDVMMPVTVIEVNLSRLMNFLS